VIRPEAVAAIDAAQAAGCKLAILSNELDLFYGATCASGCRCCASASTLHHRRHHTGILKPDPRAYRAVLDALGLPAAACVFVDDQRAMSTGRSRCTLT
jgi:putative hydrolase of the HAD superfamily